MDKKGKGTSKKIVAQETRSKSTVQIIVCSRITAFAGEPDDVNFLKEIDIGMADLRERRESGKRHLPNSTEQAQRLEESKRAYTKSLYMFNEKAHLYILFT